MTTRYVIAIEGFTGDCGELLMKEITILCNNPIGNAHYIIQFTEDEANYCEPTRTLNRLAITKHHGLHWKAGLHSKKTVYQALSKIGQNINAVVFTKGLSRIDALKPLCPNIYNLDNFGCGAWYEIIDQIKQKNSRAIEYAVPCKIHQDLGKTKFQCSLTQARILQIWTEEYLFPSQAIAPPDHITTPNINEDLENLILTEALKLEFDLVTRKNPTQTMTQTSDETTHKTNNNLHAHEETIIKIVNILDRLINIVNKLEEKINKQSVN